jgi:hypothetical protein
VSQLFGFGMVLRERLLPLPVIVLHHVAPEPRRPGQCLVGEERALFGRAGGGVNAHRRAHLQVAVDDLRKEAVLHQRQPAGHVVPALHGSPVQADFHVTGLGLQQQPAQVERFSPAGQRGGEFTAGEVRHGHGQTGLF